MYDRGVTWGRRRLYPTDRGLSMSKYSSQLDHIASEVEDLATDVLKGSYEAAVLSSKMRNVASDIDDVARQLKRQGL